MENYVVNNCAEYVEFLEHQLVVSTIVGILIFAMVVSFGFFCYFAYKSFKY